MKRVIVIGGGPAGLMAASTAASAGASVLLIEGATRLANKLRLTGGGHANLSHVGDSTAHLAHITRNPEFARPALTAMDAAALCATLAAWGLPTIADEEGRIFPASRNAHQVAAVLRSRCLAQGVGFRLASPVERILVDEGAVTGVQVGPRQITASAVILATGGASYPETGSDGSGLQLAASLGHPVTALQPGLVALRATPGQVEALQGLALPAVSVTLVQQGRPVGTRRGDLLFTQHGLSGPVIHNLSLLLAPEMRELQARLRLLASQGLEVEQARRLAADAGHRPWHSLLVPDMPLRLQRHLAARLDVRLGAPWRSLGALAQTRLLSLVDALPFDVAVATPLERATVTLGGVDVAQVEPTTLASRLVQGLYFAGEVLDVTGESGGYNLQLAFSTGHLAGQSAAQWLERGAATP